MKRITESWNRFFFTPTEPHTLGLFRIVYGLVVFIAVLGVFPHRATFYGPDAIVLPLTMEKFFAGHWMILGFSFLPLSEPAMTLFFLGLMAAALMLTLGLFTRLASLAVLVGVYSLHNRNFFICNAGDLLMRVDALVLVFADAGAGLSLDAWRRRRRGEPPSRMISPWPVRLLQLQLSYLYITTSQLKMYGESWRDGTALYYALRYLELQRFSFKYLFYYRWQIKLATWGVMTAEAMAGTLIWVRRLRYPILVVAFLLHFGINLTMQFPVFQYVMMANLTLFIMPEDLRRWIARLGLTRNENAHGSLNETRVSVAARLPLKESPAL